MLVGRVGAAAFEEKKENSERNAEIGEQCRKSGPNLILKTNNQQPLSPTQYGANDRPKEHKAKSTSHSN